MISGIAGTVTGSNVTFTIGFNGTNGNVTILSSRWYSGSPLIVGNAFTSESASTTYFGTYVVSDTSSSTSLVYIGRRSSTTTPSTKVTGTVGFSSGLAFAVSFSVPISGWA